jgi:hypothetical protein
MRGAIPPFPQYVFMAWYLVKHRGDFNYNIFIYVCICIYIKGNVKVKLPLHLTKYHTMKAYRGSEGIAPRILDLGVRCMRVVSFTPRPLYRQGKSPLVPIG